jgi:hypothetical protein
MQTFYPVFESGQVLTNAHLNQMFQWLNEQQLASRHRLLGIGIVCGLEVARKSSQVLISSGVALSSAGHLLLQQEDRAYTRYREYELPVSQALEDDQGVDSVDVPALLPLDDIELWELFETGAKATSGETPLQNLSVSFLQDKVVMLLLEAQQLSLKNCDVKSCADKGALMQFTLRRLLIREADAIRLWQAETAQHAGLYPRDLNWQALEKLLKPVAVDRLICSANALDSLEQVQAETKRIVGNGWLGLRNQLQASFDVYAHLLRDYFPLEEFPDDPWGDASELSADSHSIEDLIVNIHHYDLLVDAVASYNEFLDCAKEYEALCCPYEKRFEYHVLLGKAQPLTTVRQSANPTAGAINFNLGAQAGYPYLRHCFIPNPQFEAQHHCARKLANLYYRCWLIFKRYQTGDLLKRDLRITPSWVNAELSKKAIPYYLALNEGDDLHRNWHPDATVKGALNQVHGYHLGVNEAHPLSRVPMAHDFYRIEGLVGKPLGRAIAELRLHKSQLGLSFAIEPVLLPVQSLTDLDKFGVLAQLTRDRSLQRLFACKLSDLDMIFMIVIALLFQLLLAILYLLARLRVLLSGNATDTPATSGNLFRFAVSPKAMQDVMMTLSGTDFDQMSNVRMRLDQFGQSGQDSGFILKQVKSGDLGAKDVLGVLDDPDDPNGQMAQIYLRSREVGSGDLFERVKTVVGSDRSADELEQVYQTSRMMQQGETLMAQLAVNGIAQFDFDSFENGLAELNDANLKLMRVQSRLEQQAQPEALAMQSQMEMLGNVAGSSLLSNLGDELNKRLTGIFSEFLFEGFVARHPGTEHLCGVPKGGTLVLAYAHRSMLEKYVPPVDEKPTAAVAGLAGVNSKLESGIKISAGDLSGRAASLIQNMAIKDSSVELEFSRMISERRLKPDTFSLQDFSPAMMAKADSTKDIQASRSRASEALARLEIGSAASVEDPLNDLIIVMDFCLPTFCCDSDCSDLETADAIEPDSTPEKPVTYSLSGKIVEVEAAKRLPRASEKTLSDATLEVLDRDNKKVKVKMTRGSFTFKVKSGQTKFTASAKGYKTKSGTVQVTRSLSDIKIALEPDGKG